MRKKLKIGILIREPEQLSNWELRIIDHIFENDNYQLSLLIKDGRKHSNASNSRKNNLLKILKTTNLISKVIFKTQLLLERKIFSNVFTVNREALIKKLNTIESIYLKPRRKGFLDIFTEEQAEKVRKYELDVILRHEFNIIRGPILKAAKNGIWSFHHADNAINRGGPAGFWEIVLKQKAVGVTLQQLTPELDGGNIIDKAFFNYHWSYARTNKMVLEASVSVLIKNLKKLQDNSVQYSKSPVYFNPLYKSPNLIYTFKYLIQFYKNIVSKSLQHLKYKLFGVRYHCWTLFLGKGNFLESTLFRLKPIQLPKDEFWADPFLFKHKNKTYVFFENYSYKTKLGKISCGRIEGNEIVDVLDVLKLDYHLSYPYIFEDNGEIYMMPETNENNQLELYKCLEFPVKWELYASAFEGEKVADASFFEDDDKQKWLFVNKQIDINSPFDSELYIYKVDSLRMQNLIPHKQNPVIMNSKTARNGGAVFTYKGNTYRPSQANIEGVYGRALNINKIETLNIDEYNEATIITSFPNFKKGLKSMHHLHQLEDMFVIDAAYKKY